MPGPSDLRLPLRSLALHGPTAACHEQHAAPGSFATAMGVLVAARGRGERVIVATWITRSTCRSLVELADLLVGHGAAGWVVAWPWVRGGAGEAVPRTIPRLGIAVPHALRAVERALARGLPVGVAGVPSCALGPFAAQRVQGSEAGAYPSVCEGCPSREGCPGLDPWYLARFGARELHPVPAVRRTSDARLDELAAAVRELEAIA